MSDSQTGPVWNPDLDYRGRDVIIVGCALVAVAGLTVAGRLYSRFAITGQPGWEEGWIVIAWMASLASLCLYVKTNENGSGHHVEELTLLQLVDFFKWYWFCLWLYNIALSSTKFAIVFQYKRIFTTPRFQLAMNIMIGVLTIYGLWTVLSSVFLCWPVYVFWRPDLPGHCMPQWRIFYGNSYMNIFTDLIIVLSPLPVLSKLHMPRRQKFALAAIFMVGVVVCVISVVRLVLLIHARSETDYPYLNINPTVLSMVEVNAAIVTSSAPALKPLVIRLFPRFGSTRSGNGSKTTRNARSMAGENSRTDGTLHHPDRVDIELASGRITDRPGWIEEEEDEGALLDNKVSVVTTITTEITSADPASSTGGTDGSRARHPSGTAFGGV